MELDNKSQFIHDKQSKIYVRVPLESGEYFIPRYGKVDIAFRICSTLEFNRMRVYEILKVDDPAILSDAEFIRPVMKCLDTLLDS